MYLVIRCICLIVTQGLANMYVANELAKSVTEFIEMCNNLDKIDSVAELDLFEVKLQKLVFKLQMQANQVAGKIAPIIIEKRHSLNNSTAVYVRNRLAQIRERIKQQEEQDALSNNIDDINNDEKVEEKVEEKNDRNSNRQRKSNSGNGKSKSSKKTK